MKKCRQEEIKKLKKENVKGEENRNNWCVSSEGTIKCIEGHGDQISCLNVPEKNLPVHTQSWCWFAYIYPWRQFRKFSLCKTPSSALCCKASCQHQLHWRSLSPTRSKGVEGAYFLWGVFGHPEGVVAWPSGTMYLAKTSPATDRNLYPRPSNLTDVSLASSSELLTP